GGSDGIGTDVVNLERPCVSVAQHHVGRAVLIEIGETRDLKVEPNRADVEGRRDLIIDNVVKLELAGTDAAQHHVGRTVGIEVAKSCDLKVQPDRAQV